MKSLQIKIILLLIMLLYFVNTRAAEVKPQTINVEMTQECARVYKFKNYRVMRALHFRTKRNKSKLA